MIEQIHNTDQLLPSLVFTSILSERGEYPYTEEIIYLNIPTDVTPSQEVLIKLLETRIRVHTIECHSHCNLKQIKLQINACRNIKLRYASILVANKW